MLDIIKQIFFKEKVKIEDLSPEEKINEMFESLDSDVITFLVGEDFVEYKFEALECINEQRESIKEEWGFIFPAIHILSSEKLQSNEFVVKVQGKKVLESYFIPNKEGIAEEIERAFSFVYKNYLGEVFTCEIAEKYFTFVQQKKPWTIWNITSMYSIVEVRDVLLGLLENKKSIRNINYVMDKFAEYTLESGFCQHLPAQKIVQRLLSKL